MQRQGSFSEAEYAGKKKQTRRDKFLSEMERVVPWARLVERLRPFYPKGERGRPPIGLERMLRIHFLQQWYVWCADRASLQYRLRADDPHRSASAQPCPAVLGQPELRPARDHRCGQCQNRGGTERFADRPHLGKWRGGLGRRHPFRGAEQ